MFRRLASSIRDFFKGLFSGYATHIDPPVFACRDGLDALQRATTIGPAYHTSGTPSMLPLIPSPAISILATIKPAFDPSYLLGRVLCYWAKWHPQSVVCHRAVAADSYGLIMSGDNNQYSEPMERVTTENFVGEVAAIFTYPQT